MRRLLSVSVAASILAVAGAAPAAKTCEEKCTAAHDKCTKLTEGIYKKGMARLDKWKERADKRAEKSKSADKIKARNQKKYDAIKARHDKKRDLNTKFCGHKKARCDKRCAPKTAKAPPAKKAPTKKAPAKKAPAKKAPAKKGAKSAK